MSSRADETRQADAAPAAAAWADIGRVAFGVAGIVALLVSIGIFVSQLMLMYYDKSIDVTLPMVAAILLTFLAPLVGILLGPRSAVVITTLLLAVAMFVETLVREQNAQLVAAAVGVIAGAWWFAFLVATAAGRGSSLSLTLPLALASVLVLRAATATEPLDEVSLPVTLVVGGGVILGLLFGAQSVLRRAVGWQTTDRRGALALIAIPFLFLLALDLALNGAVAAGAAGIGLGPIGSASTEVGLLAVGIGVGLGMALIAVGAAPGWLGSVSIVLGAVLLWGRIGLLPLVGGGLLGCGIVLCASGLGDLALAEAPRPTRVGVALAVGWVGAFVGTLLYYVGVGLTPVLATMLGVVALAAWLARSRDHAQQQSPGRGLQRIAAAVGILAIAVPALEVAAPPAVAVPAAPPVATAASRMRVMTYNIHLGYDDGDVPAEPAIADTIAAAAPDVVALEEVTRGMIIAGGHDDLALLAARLHMSYAFAPMLGDIEGVAILSRFPIAGTDVVPLAQQAGKADIRRVLLIARVADLSIAVTHLGGPDLVVEARSIVVAAGDRKPLIVAGDMNSVPGSPQMRLFAAAGFTDLGAQARAATVPPSDPAERIDFLWGSGVSLLGTETIRTTASDHLPVVAEVSVP